jgi:HEAT repeat protein
MPAKRTFDAELATLDALRDASPEAADPELAKALTHRNNLIVSKAATLTLHHQLTGLTPNLAAAFTRFVENSAKSDPQCWAKNALAKALAAFEYQEPELFLVGMRHIQLEPGWGGSTDTAGTLRSTCALALVQCRELNSHRLLTHLVPLLADKELPVRINVVRAIEQVGTDSATLLLRMLAELPQMIPNSTERASLVFWRLKVLPLSTGPVGSFLAKMILPRRPSWQSPRPTP